MSKTAIDFFSKGLDGHKTKLSVSVFGLDVKYQIREMAQKRKTSLPHFNCGRIQKRHDKQQLDYVSESNKNNKMASTFTSFNSCNLSPTRSSNIKNQGDTIHSLPYSKRQINLEQIVNLKEQLKPRTTKIPPLIDIENRSKNKFEPILRITEVCEPHEESFGSNGYALDKNLQTEKYISQQLNDRKKQADCRIRLSQNLETKKKKNYYFISNLVLQTSEPQRSSIQHHHISQQRRIGVQNMRYLQSIKTNLAQSKKQKQDTKQEIKLPNSLKARKIVYFSCSDKPLKKKQRSKKSILLIQSKSPKVAKNVDFGIDRWEYKKDEVNSWDF